MAKPSRSPQPPSSSNFIRQIIEADLASGKHKRICTRFPPEPNGYLHFGHAKSICLNFGLAKDFGGRCNLRFDDTNPEKEEQEYVDSIIDSVKWLGFDFGPEALYASDYFGFMYKAAENLISAGHAYVDSQSADEMRQNRGTLTSPGKESPFRGRPAEENLRLFREMREGRHPDGSMVLRTKIDMASPNINLRDPAIYRIKHAEHHRTGRDWCIYPMYTYAHPIEDAIENITHSICTLEFEDQRPFYDWLLERLAEGGLLKRPLPKQIEFARLNLSHTVLSKRKLIQLVEYCIREELNKSTPRVMSVLHPLRVVIENYPEGQTEELEAVNNPEDAAMGTRKVPFSRVLYIEQEDFREDPPKQFFRLAPGREVRLRYAYIIKCIDVVKDPKTGAVTELRCTYDPETKSGSAQSNRKVKATLHWVSAAQALEAEVRSYDHLFSKENPEDVEEGADWTANLNPTSLATLTSCRVEPNLTCATPGNRYQFERLGYFCVDTDSSDGRMVFNRTVTLRDTWAKIEKAQKKG